MAWGWNFPKTEIHPSLKFGTVQQATGSMNRNIKNWSLYKLTLNVILFNMKLFHSIKYCMQILSVVVKISVCSNSLFWSLLIEMPHMVHNQLHVFLNVSFSFTIWMLKIFKPKCQRKCNTCFLSQINII